MHTSKMIEKEIAHEDTILKTLHDLPLFGLKEGK